MTFELSIILMLVVIIIYMIVIKIYSILFQITGLPKNISKYQAISLFTNCGFTTNESETITTNKFRRRISLACMITGNFFSVIIVSLIVSLISTFSEEKNHETYIFVSVCFGVFIGVLLILQIPFIKRFLSNLLDRLVAFFVKRANKDNILTIVDNFGSHAIVEIYMHHVPSILVNKTIHEAKLKGHFNINILSVKRNKRQIEITRNTLVQKDDVLLVFGAFSDIKDIFSSNITLEQKQHHQKKFNELDLIDNYGNKAMVEVTINEVPLILHNKTLFDSELKENYGINVIFIKREEEVVEVVRDTIICKGDTVVVFGPYQSIKNIFLY